MPDISKGHTFASGDSVDHSKLNNLVGNATINDGAITAGKLATGAVTSAKILDGAIANSDISDNADMALSKLASGSEHQVLVVDSSGKPQYVAMSGDATMASGGAMTIAAGAVEHSMLATGVLPSGAIMQYAGTSAPTGWLFCDGSTFDSGTYSDLATVLGDTYGTSSGTTYYLPDLRGRIPMGTNDDGMPNGKITTDTARPTERNEGATGGTETHLLTGSESGTSAHGHNVKTFNTDWDATLNAGNPPAGKASAATSSAVYTGSDGVQAAAAADASSAHANTQPFVVVNFIIKT